MPPLHPKSKRPLPLSTLLSFTLVAFTIELDNEFEHQFPHRTSRRGHSALPDPHQPSPWLVSLAMHLNCMQFLDAAQPLTIRDLFIRARTRTHLRGMHRWGYLKITPPANAPRTKNKKPDGTWIVTPTPAGLRAQQIWRTTLPAIENRWRDRFGNAEITQLRAALAALVAQLPSSFPDCLPILQYALLTKVSPRVLEELAQPDRPAHPSAESGPAADALPLPTLLSRVLLALALDFERDSPISLAISANLLRVLSASPTPVRELPALTGTSKESLAMAAKILLKKSFAKLEPIKSQRGKALRPTPQGLRAQRASDDLLTDIEQVWQKRFGPENIHALRAALERLALDPSPAERSPLLRCLQPHPDNWRAQLPPPLTLPHFPLTLHRGAFPDGS